MEQLLLRRDRLRSVSIPPPAWPVRLDMAGNVAEWTLNAGGQGRYVLGGSWAEPAYLINAADSVCSRDTASDHRFPLRALRRTDRRPSCSRDPWSSPRSISANILPMSDEAFEQTRRFHAYHRSPLAAEVESSETLSWGAREEWVTIDAAYPGERIPIRLRLPTKGSPPYQVVVIGHSLEMSLRAHSARASV